jgi:hypothetical protein
VRSARLGEAVTVIVTDLLLFLVRMVTLGFVLIALAVRVLYWLMGKETWK